MCLGICGQITSVNGSNAYVNILGVKTLVNILLIDNPQIGDYILIHAGYAIAKVDEKYALTNEKLIKEYLQDD